MVRGGVIAGLVLLLAAAVWWLAGADDRRLDGRMEHVLRGGGPVKGEDVGALRVETAVLLPDGRTLRLVFTGGASQGDCAETYAGRAVESARFVVVAVVTTTGFRFGERTCTAVGYERMVDVTLDRPLEARGVLDVTTGGPVRLSASARPIPGRDLAPTPS
ncbi:hypothetical protein FDA94_24475 [Herbidospora galbida]|uniref:Uncharacterized protein n=1 Tax=Herbidospora galbida TaxID=2575442 RepID=A0A4U3MAX8_9ACTN|nr:hypothetical protein [Herbidospora galbida]TKK85790.1 hypothetical protein FDA94_24475 [Herbidospora galbida]